MIVQLQPHSHANMHTHILATAIKIWSTPYCLNYYVVSWVCAAAFFYEWLPYYQDEEGISCEKNVKRFLLHAWELSVGEESSILQHFQL